jgi:hypothetical protein
MDTWEYAFWFFPELLVNSTPKAFEHLVKFPSIFWLLICHAQSNRQAGIFPDLLGLTEEWNKPFQIVDPMTQLSERSLKFGQTSVLIKYKNLSQTIYSSQL